MDAALRLPSQTRASLFTLALALLCFGMGGCLSQDERKEMAASDSVLAPLFKRPTPADAAAWATDPFDADKRARGLNMLANAPFGGAEVYVTMYRQRVADEQEHASVRAIACRALALHGSSEDVARIIPLTTSQSVQLRLESTRALQRLHNPAAVPALRARLEMEKESEAEVRAEAASALGQYADEAVLQALIASLADPSLLVDVNAHESLRTLTGQDQLSTELKDWVQWAKQNPGKHFAGQRAYVYPVFWREKRWLDYVPFMPPVPNETASTPVGFSLERSGPAPAPLAAVGTPTPAPRNGTAEWVSGQPVQHP